MADQTIERVYKHNSTLVQRFLRTQEMAGFSCVLEDVTHEVLAQLLNDNTIDDEPAGREVPASAASGSTVAL